MASMLDLRTDLVPERRIGLFAAGALLIWTSRNATIVNYAKAFSLNSSLL
jgi:hypothetical protein